VIAKDAKSQCANAGTFIVLRHQDGDAWDYAVITHLGTKATVKLLGQLCL